MPKRIEPMERREIVRRLKENQKLREIKRDTGISRKTLRRIKQVADEKGWLESKDLPTEEEIVKCFKINLNKPHPLDKIKEKIKEWVEAEYTYVVITRLVNKRSFNYNEITVRRYIKNNFPQIKKAVIRRDFKPGKVAEVDFGYLGLMYDEKENRIRKAWIFSLRLNNSRKAYREIVFTQKAEVFFLCHIHGFEYFGGVPKKIVCDNLKSAVIKASLKEPVVNRAYRMLAEYYDFLISPALPGKPEHKGGVEKDIDYVKRNFYPVFIEDQKELGRKVPYYRDAVKALVEWTNDIDDKHIIKYVGESPEKLFVQEKEYLIKLPVMRWNMVKWYTPKVGVDWRVQIGKSFYSVPYEYIGKTVYAYVRLNEVIIYYNYKLITLHQKATKPWEKVIKKEHGPPQYEEYLKTTSVGLRRWASFLGEYTAEIVNKLLNQKGIDGLRTSRGVCGLSKKYGISRLEKACKRALHYNLISYGSIKDILIKELDKLPIDAIKNDSMNNNILFKEESFKYSRTGRYYDI